VAQEKGETMTRSPETDLDTVINLKVVLQTDKAGKLVLETLDDLNNIMLLRKRKRERKTPASKPIPATPYYVDEDDFFKACEHNQLPVIEKFLKDGGDVNSQDNFQRTGLHKACFRGHIEVARRLVEAKADVHMRDKLGSSCVHAACRGGCLSVLELLLDNGAMDSTPLHVSVRIGHYDFVEHLIRCGAEINAVDKEGDSPLHDAVRVNGVKLIELLVAYGADQRLINQVEGQCPLDSVLEWQSGAKTLLAEPGATG
uniref:Ankyrin repeat domain 1a (cardiac muscle) n=1 Tax=Gadus morhua TaxID=8049 RepID=A0A8C4ZEY7_GADMO